MAAVGDGASGGIYISTNSGLTWTQTSAPNLNWWSVASSTDGTKLVAAAGNDLDGNGGIYTSTNSGFTWTQTSAPGSQSVYYVASSSDGSKLVEADYFGGVICTSTNSGLTWTQTSAPDNPWHYVASSSDGRKLVAVAYGGGIYATTNSGFTWAQTGATNLEWFFTASSSDGSKLAAITLDPAAIGRSTCLIYTSTNSGLTWKISTAPSTGWWSVASSSDGTKLATVSQYGEIYKGAITNNSSQTTPPSLTLQFLSGYPLLSLYGTLGDTYTVQYATNLAASNWTPMLIVPNLSISPFQMIDPAGVGQSMRFYRAMQQ